MMKVFANSGKTINSRVGALRASRGQLGPTNPAGRYIAEYGSAFETARPTRSGYQNYRARGRAQFVPSRGRLYTGGRYNY